MKIKFNYSHKILVQFVLLNLCFSGFSQISVKTSLPSEFNNFWTENHLKKVITKGNNDDSQIFWSVVSSGEDIPTYESSANYNRVVQENLNYLQRLVVYEMKGEMLHLMQPNSPNDGLRFPYLKNNAKDYGWVSIHDVIPSRFPKNQTLDNDEHFAVFNEKAICTHVVDAEAETQEIEKMKFYKGARNNIPSNSDVVGEYPYYVFGKQDNRVLLSERAIIDISNEAAVKQQIAGWIDEEHVEIITNRICWEPNYGNEPEAIYNGITQGVYPEFTFAEKFVSDAKNISGQNLQPFEVEKVRSNKNFQRMYQRKPANNGISEVLILGNPNPAKEELMAEVTELRNSLSHINILFVMDATKSMKNVFRPASEAIANAMKELNQKIETNTDLVNSMKFAVAIYRHELDEDKGYDFKDFTENSQEIINYLNNVECKSKNPDLPESVFQGLIKSMRNFKKNEKNIVIWIGDAGNQRENVDDQKSEIINLSNKFDVNWAVFQIENFTTRTNNQTYDYFILDAQDIIKGSAEKLLKKMKVKNSSKHKLFYHNADYTHSDLDLLSSKKGSEGYLMFANIQSPLDGDKLPQEFITEKIEDVIIGMYENTKIEIGGTKNVQRTKLNGVDIELQSVPMYEWLLRKGFTEEEIAILSEKTFRVKGYLPIYTYDKFDKFSTYATKEVVMLTCKELDHKKRMMDKLLDVKSRPVAEQRTQLLKEFTNNMVLLTGNNINDVSKQLKRKIYKMTFDELWTSLFGIHFYKTKFRDKEISSIKDENTWTDQDIKEFVIRITKSHARLQNIICSEYEYRRNTGIKTKGGDNIFLYLPRDKYFP